MKIRLLLPLCFLVACSNAKDPDDGAGDSGGGWDLGTDGDADTDTDSDGETDTDGGDTDADGGDTDADTDTDGATGDALPFAVNELLASNDTVHSDENGDFDDWIELFNPSGAALDIGGWQFTDDFGVEDPWVAPDGLTIPAGGFLILWCDEEPEQGDAHTTFKLSGDGETLTVLDPDGAVAFELTYGKQVTDISWARVPDGTGDFGPLDPPTPGAGND